MQPSPPRHVADAASLAVLADELRELDRVGVDTEFHTERRYEPELFLVQLADDRGRAWIVDPKSCDLRRLGPALAGLTWVAHGASWDVALLRREAGARPARLVDTQLAAGIAGLGWPVRLGDLAATVLGERVDKGDALSDWSARPLDPAQLRYAVDDARLALRLADALRERLGARRWRWVEMAGEELVAEALAPPDPDARWRRMEVAHTFDEATRRALHALHAWRARRARDKGTPPHYVLSDALALDLARRRPRSRTELARNRRVPNGLVRRHADELLAVIREAESGEAPPVPDRAAWRLARGLHAWAAALEPELGVVADLLLPRELALRVAEAGAEAFTGWRAEAAGEALADFLKGRTRVAVGTDERGRPVLRLR